MLRQPQLQHRGRFTAGVYRGTSFRARAAMPTSTAVMPVNITIQEPTATHVSASIGSAMEAGIKRTEVPHAAKAWEFFRAMGSPRFHVAPMVDQSELPFRMLCRNHGATCAYTPMMHARLFAESDKYRSEFFTTCPEDRPLMVQFCANDPDLLLAAARHVEGSCDAVDINFGCPQRIAKRGNYGATLMDDLPLVERLVKKLAQNLSVPVTCKIRVFPDMAKTLAYAAMIEAAGCSLLAVHGRTREMKDLSNTRADWDAIRAVKQHLSIPVLANGNIRTLQDAHDLMAYTGCDGVLSAESLLEDPALFAPSRLEPEGAHSWLEAPSLLREYLQLVKKYPTHPRMVKGHLHKILQPWLAEHIDIRDRVNKGSLNTDGLIALLEELDGRIIANGWDTPRPRATPRQLLKQAAEANKQAAMDEQQRETEALEEMVNANTHKRHAEDADDHVHGGARQAVEASDGGSSRREASTTAATLPHASGEGHTANGAPDVSCSERVQHSPPEGPEEAMLNGDSHTGVLEADTHVALSALEGLGVEADTDLKRLRDLGGVDGCVDCL